MVLIDNWLSGNKNYMVGTTLYETFGTDMALQSLFDQGETPYSKKRLEEALRGLLLQPDECQAPEGPAAPAPSTPAGDMPAGTDNVLQAIHNEWNAKYQRMKYLQVSLDKYGEDNSPETIAASQPICTEILLLEKEVNVLWERRDYYLQHGALPEMPEEVFVIPSDPLAIGRLVETLKRNIRRNKQEATRNPANPTYPALVNIYTERLNLVNAKLKKD